MFRLKSLALAVSLMFTLGAGAQRIALVGDSHVALKTYPQTLERILGEEVPGAGFESLGIGGAGFYTYVDKPANMKRIYALRPEILIVALGTNDCNNWYYSADKLRQRATRLYNGVKEQYPDCKVVFVTPFCFKTKVVRGKDLEINPNVGATADVLNEMARELPDVWTIDLMAEHGMDFLDGDLMMKDFIHLTKPGYEHLARLVADGLLTQPGLLDTSAGPIDPE